MRSVVVFPAPFGPSRPKQTPCGTCRSRLSTATRSANFFVTERSSMMGDGDANHTAFTQLKVSMESDVSPLLSQDGLRSARVELVDKTFGFKLGDQRAIDEIFRFDLRRLGNGRGELFEGH